MALAATSSSVFSFFTSTSPPPKSPASHLSCISIKDQRAPLISSNELPPPEVVSAVCPSLAYANTLFFRSGYNVQVIVDDNEPEERLIGRFRREVMRAGVIQECKRRRFFENKQEEKKRRTRDAAKRNRRSRQRPPPRMTFQERQEEASKTKKSDDDEDNWDLPEGGLP